MIKKLTIALAMGVMALSPLTKLKIRTKINEIVEMLKANPVVDGLHESLACMLQQQQFDQLLSSSQEYINDPKHNLRQKMRN